MEKAELDKLFADCVAAEDTKPAVEPEVTRELGMVVTPKDRQEALRRNAERQTAKARECAPN